MARGQGYYTDILSDTGKRQPPQKPKPKPKPKLRTGPPITPWGWGPGNPPGTTWSTGSTACTQPTGEFGNNFTNQVTLNVPNPLPCNTSFYVEIEITTDGFAGGQGSPDPPGSYPPHPWASNNPNQAWIGGSQWDGTYRILTNGPSTIADQSISFTGLYSNYYVARMTACECDGAQGTTPPTSMYGDPPEYYNNLIMGQTLQNCCQTGSTSQLLLNMPYGYRDWWAHDPTTMTYPGNIPAGMITDISTGATAGNPNLSTGTSVPIASLPNGTVFPWNWEMQNLVANMQFANQSSICEWCVDWWLGTQNNGVPNVPGGFKSALWYGQEAHLYWGFTTAQMEEACACCPDILANPPAFATFAIPPIAEWCGGPC